MLVGGLLLLGGAACGVLFWPPGAVLAGLLLLGVLLFFRDPERRADCGPEDLLSPADGVVHDVGEVASPGFLDGPAVRIGVFMSVLDVHVNRSPVDGAVRWTSYHPGKFHDARAEASLTENEHHLMGLELRDGRRLVVNQIAGLVARRIVCAASEGDSLRRGQRFGMVKFGSRVELYLPCTDPYEIRVEPGDRVRAGLTVLATYTDGPASRALPDSEAPAANGP
jgi:phosphatidylserine decarboxylase